MKRKRQDLPDEEEEDNDQPAAKRLCEAAFDTLPDELIAYICNYLDWESMPTFRFTCRRFYRLVNDWIDTQRKRGRIPAFVLTPRSPSTDEHIKQLLITCYLVEKGTETSASVTRLPLVWVIQSFYRKEEKLAGFPYDDLSKLRTAFGECYFTDGDRMVRLCTYEEHYYLVFGFADIRLTCVVPRPDRGTYHHFSSPKCTIVATNCLEDCLLWRRTCHGGRPCGNCEALLKYHTSLTK